jgi:hypothetical protein
VRTFQGGARSLKQQHAASYALLLVSGQALPPSIEFVSELDIPILVGSMPYCSYERKCIIMRLKSGTSRSMRARRLVPYFVSAAASATVSGKTSAAAPLR